MTNDAFELLYRLVKVVLITGFWLLFNFRHRELAFGPGEVRFVDASRIPTYKQPASAVFKCLNPPSCN